MFQLLMLLLGLILEGIAIFFIVIPIVAPLVDALGFDPIHFYLLMLLNVIIGNESPPFGLSLFVLKGVVPHVSMADIYRAQLPFVAMDMVAMLLIVFFPQIALWLPNKLFD
jgi:TRAP-type C4-dicarboxylate transport system permease large subunit